MQVRRRAADAVSGVSPAKSLGNGTDCAELLDSNGRSDDTTISTRKIPRHRQAK